MAFKRYDGMAINLCVAYLLMLVSMTLTLMQGYNGSAKAKHTNVELFRQLSKQ